VTPYYQYDGGSSFGDDVVIVVVVGHSCGGVKSCYGEVRQAWNGVTSGDDAAQCGVVTSAGGRHYSHVVTHRLAAALPQ